MHLKIVPKPFSLSGKRKIFVDDEERFYAITYSIAGQECVKLIDKQDDIVLSIIIREFSLFQDSYTIRFLNEDNIPIAFGRPDKWHHNYVGNYHGDTYAIWEDADRFYVISKNGIETGRWLYAGSGFMGNYDFFKIKTTENLHLILSLCLIIHYKECDKRNPG